MLFNSHIFIFVFLPLVLAGWYGLNRIKWYKAAQGYLIGMSLWFYAYFDIHYLWTMLASCAVGYGFCFLIKKAEKERVRRILLAAGCLFHLGLLGYFKYSNFFLENINAAFGTKLALIGVLLPVGISFYTFQQLAYLIDCKRQDAPLYSFWDYLLFMVYFPQVLQGPILLHGELVPQFHEEARRRFDGVRFAAGIQHFVIGLAKKVLLADTLAKAVNFGYDNVAGLDSVSAVFLAVGYLFELYFDFSGYCDMAVGLGKMIGLEIVENFDSPFKSASVKEFWRRWHITLGRFFTKYVYIPLGGSKKGYVRMLVNTMIVFLLSGLWHGAAWTFVFWGLLHGIGVCAGSLKGQKKKTPRTAAPVGRAGSGASEPEMREASPTGRAVLRAKQAACFIYVCLAFVFFRAESVAQGFAVLRAMVALKWNGSLFRMAEALDVSELYIFTKALSMKAPEALDWFHLAVLLLVFGISLAVLAGKRACAMVQQTAFSTRQALWMAFLFTWSILSMAGISTYIYFSF